MTKISVVMATFNGEKYLEGQLNSILSQTLKPDEIIVNDDCSTDATLEILRRYKLEHQINVFVNFEQLGLIENFKKAVSKAKTGNYIALSDQDDVWYPEKLEKCASSLLNFDQNDIPCLVHSDLLFVDTNDNVLNSSFRRSLGQHKYQQNLSTLVYGNFVNGCTSLFNPVLRKFFLSMPDSIALNHDGWMALIAFTFGRAAYVDEPLVRYRKHENNASISYEKRIDNRYINVVKQLFESFKSNDSFMKAQFDTVEQFYQCYHTVITEDKQKIFEDFLKLKNAGFLTKKLAFARMVRQYPLL